MRAFGQTRYLIRMIVEVFKDMRSFALILVLSILGFATIFHLVSPQLNIETGTGEWIIP